MSLRASDAPGEDIKWVSVTLSMCLGHLFRAWATGQRASGLRPLKTLARLLPHRTQNASGKAAAPGSGEKRSGGPGSKASEP